MKQAIVDKNPMVSSSALVAGMHLMGKSPEIVRRWWVEPGFDIYYWISRVVVGATNDCVFVGIITTTTTTIFTG